MEATFWQDKWNNNDIAFHERKANPMLVNNIEKLHLNPGARIFIPLCGKTIDIAWLLSKGYKVAGCELVEIAIEQLFEELNIKPDISSTGSMKIYKGNNIEIFVGDIFGLDKPMLGNIDAIYDRAALVALPFEMRQRYTKHIANISGCAPQLLIVFQYDQQLSAPPPFSISGKELENHYGGLYNIINIKAIPVLGRLKGKCPAMENAWLLIKRQ